MIPRATYRVQFHAGFTFADGAKIAPYLAQLGISHLYASPILHARAGSTHGYDVVDHRRINPELGGEDGFRAMAAALRTHGIGIVLDIVPNHMAVGGADNPWWLDVLEKGPASPFAHYFDIDWSPGSPALLNRILAPFLGAPYDEVLGAGEISLIWDETLGRLAFAYHDHRFPVRAGDYGEICGGAAPQDADLSSWNAPDVLHRLLERQHFRLAWWRTASDQINWRRFFTINELAALRAEEPRVFDATHAKILELYAEGLIDGVRVDHIDGLSDPGRYCRHLRRQLARRRRERPDAAARPVPYLVVEKILARGETVRADWVVAGTTGYDFMNDVSALQHNAKGEGPLSTLWTQISSRPSDFHVEERLARQQVLLSAFESPLDALVRACRRLAPESTSAHDITGPALRRAVIALMEEFRAYRTYATGTGEVAQPDPFVEAAMTAALARTNPVDAAALRHLGDALFGPGIPQGQTRMRALRRFNQLTAPLAAKAVEDTALYRHGRLLSRNDVGFDPSEFAIQTDQFHRRASTRAETAAQGLLTTATHDHKRGEDVRARLAVLSEIPDEWRKTVSAWIDRNAPLRSSLIGQGDEYQLYQTLVGSWPMMLRADDATGLSEFATRILAWQQKALREAKLHTSWADPDARFEAANRDFVQAILDPAHSRGFLREMEAFVLRIAPAGVLNGLAQTALRCTAPGVPDLYQGAEVWDFSLVDPDNRRPIDYRARATSLDGAGTPADTLTHWQDGIAKQRLIARLLGLRAQNPELFTDGAYQPVPLRGPRAANVLAFIRRTSDTTILVAVPRLCAESVIAAGRPLPPAGFWGDTALLATDRWVNALGGSGPVDKSCAELFATFPAAVLAKAD